MDSPLARAHQLAGCRTPERHAKYVAYGLAHRHSPESKKHMGEIQRVVQNRPEVKQKVILGQPNRIEIYMLDKADSVIKKFDSIGEACRYLGRPSRDAGCINDYADSRNKNGKRSRFLGYYWSYSDPSENKV